MVLQETSDTESIKTQVKPASELQDVMYWGQSLRLLT
jgi:hypothetical protein